ncbi:MAG: signal peptidase II [Spirochaetales bacterium]|nr:signal peptidase II [Spirochaetales bacterium]
MKIQPKILLPFSLTLFILISDQLTKLLVVQNIPINTIGHTLFGGFLRIIHVRNLGIAFSMGDGLSNIFRIGLFIVLPLCVLTFMVFYYLRHTDITFLQRWIMTGILGGGLGNIIDRIFRTEGVVDFIDFKFYGILGMNRFPTFNIADMSVVICGFLLVVSFIIEERKKNEQES